MECMDGSDTSIKVINDLMNEEISWEVISEYLKDENFQPSVLDNQLLFMSINYNKKTITQKILSHKNSNPYIKNLDDLPITLAVFKKRKTITRMLLDHFKVDYLSGIKVTVSGTTKKEIESVYAEAEDHYNKILQYLGYSPKPKPRRSTDTFVSNPFDVKTFKCSPFTINFD